MIGQNSCSAMIKQIHDALEKDANNAMRPQGLTMAQLGVLLVLYDFPEGELPLKELEQTLHVAQSTAAGIVARLEQKNFVEGYTSAEDRRVKMVRITAEGVACCQESQKSMENTEARLLSKLTEEERELFHSMLQKVRDTLL